MISHLLELQTQLEDITTVIVAAGRPSAPTGSDCERIYIWLADVQDNNLDDNCIVDTHLTIGYEIHGCYRDDAEDQPASVFLEDATRFTNLVDEVWTTLVDYRDAGTLAGASKCDEVTLNPLTVTPRSGTHISAIGTMFVQHRL